MTLHQICTDLQLDVFQKRKKCIHDIGSTFDKTKGKPLSHLLKTYPRQLFCDKYFLYLPEQKAICVKIIRIGVFENVLYLIDLRNSILCRKLPTTIFIFLTTNVFFFFLTVTRLVVICK